MNTMSDDAVFLVLFVALVFIGTSIRGYYTRKIQKTQERLSIKERVAEIVRSEGKASAVLLIVQGVYLIALLPPYVLFPSTFLLFQIPLPSWFQWAGVALGFLSLPFLVWVHYVLNKEWSVTLKLQTDHKLVTTGPYRRIRHPMYTVHLAYFLSWVLVSANFLFLIYYVLAILLIMLRIPKEEQMMMEKFGEEYRVYMKRTGRLLPYFGPKKDNED
jgi:protein-S-isoprenylcysteine O-methyltransferase Ste14